MTARCVCNYIDIIQIIIKPGTYLVYVKCLLLFLLSGNQCNNFGLSEGFVRRLA